MEQFQRRWVTAVVGKKMTATANITLLGVKVLVWYAGKRGPVFLHNEHQMYYSFQRGNV